MEEMKQVQDQYLGDIETTINGIEVTLKCIRLLGEGSSCYVYLYEDVKAGVRIADKKQKPNQSSLTAESVYLGKLLKDIPHSHMPIFYGRGFVDGSITMMLEYIEDSLENYY